MWQTMERRAFLFGAAIAGTAAIPASAGETPMTSSDVTFPQCRLSLIPGAPVPDTDVAGAITIYCMSSGIGRYVPVWDGSAWVSADISAGIALSLDANAGHTGYQQSGKNYDLFIIMDGVTPHLATGPAWNEGGGSNTARGSGAGSTELEYFEGLPVNKNSISLRFGDDSGDVATIPARSASYVGSFTATANGQASDTKRRRLLFNAYNKVLRPLKASEPAVSWIYSALAYTQANGNPNNEVEILSGLSGVMVDLTASALGSTAAGLFIQTAIGLDSVSQPSQDSTTGLFTSAAGGTVQASARYCGYPGLGKRSLKWLVSGNGIGEQTFYGTNGETTVFKVGLVGSMLG